MNYHNITYPDMLNGDGLRVVLWLSGCSHHCKGCQNPQTWDTNSGIPFNKEAKEELFRELNNDYISGITFSGGDPLHENNLDEVLQLITEIRAEYPNKTIWLYTGFTWNQTMSKQSEMDHAIQVLEESRYKHIFYNKNDIFEYKPDIYSLRKEIISQCDVLVDGRYVDELRDISLHWRGSSNQRVIDVQKSLEKGEIVLWSS